MLRHINLFIMGMLNAQEENTYMITTDLLHLFEFCDVILSDY